jgi:hypothetical protein
MNLWFAPFSARAFLSIARVVSHIFWQHCSISASSPKGNTPPLICSEIGVYKKPMCKRIPEGSRVRQYGVKAGFLMDPERRVHGFLSTRQAIDPLFRVFQNAETPASARVRFSHPCSSAPSPPAAAV